MADNTIADPGAGGDTFRDKDRAGVKTTIVGIDLGIGTGTENLMAGTMPVSGTVTATTGGLTDTQLRATPVPVSGTVTATGPLTDTQLRATPVPVSGTVTANLGTAAVTNAGTFAVQADTELPAAAALADGAANPTAPGVGAFGLLWNGTTWDRAPGNATNGRYVDIRSLAGTAVDTNSGSKSPGTQRVVLATDQPALTNALKVDPSAVTSPVSAAALPLPTGAATAAKQPALGTAGAASTDVITVQGIASGTAQPVSGTVAVSAGNITISGGTVSLQAGVGYTPVLYAAQTTTVQTAKGTAGVLGGWMIWNPNASVAYVQIFNAATATTVTLGTTAPLMSLPIPPGSSANMASDVAFAFSAGIKLACTTTATGLTAPSTGLDVNVFFK